MSAESFHNRNATMQKGITYPPAYQPYHLLNGHILRFDKGVNGLTSSSSPDNVMATYVPDSNKAPAGFAYDLMDKRNYFWPQPDEAYARFLQ